MKAALCFDALVCFCQITRRHIAERRNLHLCNIHCLLQGLLLFERLGLMALGGGSVGWLTQSLGAALLIPVYTGDSPAGTELHSACQDD
jgi:hypothetical protein